MFYGLNNKLKIVTICKENIFIRKHLLKVVSCALLFSAYIVNTSFANTKAPPPPPISSAPPAPSAPSEEKVQNTNATNTDAKVALNDISIKDNKSISIVTASGMGVYYPIGSNICRLVNHNRNQLHLDCNSLLSSGSIKNLMLLDKAEVDFAIVQADLAEAAVYGTDMFKVANDKLRLVSALHNEPLVAIVRADSKIQTLSDISGKILNLDGITNSSMSKIINIIFKANGWTQSSFKRIANFGVDEQPEALCNGQIDVAMLMAGNPNKIVQKISKLCEIRILEIADPGIINFIKNDLAFIITKIPGGLYLGVPQDVNTIGVRAVLTTTSNENDDVVYKVMQTIVENITYLQKITRAWGDSDVIQDTLAMQNVIPLHNGALRYINEKNKQVPEAPKAQQIPGAGGPQTPQTSTVSK